MPIDYDEFIATLTYSKIVDMSATSVALCLSALQTVSQRYNWNRSGASLTDTEWNDIDAMIANTYEELMTSLVGLIFPHVMATASVFKFLPCDGGVYLKEDYPLLYDAIDATYIVSGTQFRVPDMRDRVPVGVGNNYSVDDSGGADSVTLSIAQIPSHDHIYQYPNPGLDLEAPGAPDILALSNPGTPFSTSSVGGGQSHENRMPYRAIGFVIVAG